MILIDPLDAGPELDGSIFLRCFSTLWYYRNRPTLYCKTEDWAVLFDILLCFMPVYKNANDDHRGGHLDYSWASQSCLFLSGLLSLHLFSNPCSLRLEFHRQWWRAVVSECPSIRMGMCRWRQSWTIFVCVCVQKFLPLVTLGLYLAISHPVQPSCLSACSSSLSKELFSSQCARPSHCPLLFSRWVSFGSLYASAVLHVRLTSVCPVPPSQTAS